MNGLILILSLIVIGYIYQTKNQVTKFKITEMQAHHIYYKSAIIGFYFFVFGLVVTILLLYFFSICKYDFEKNLIENISNLPDLKVVWVFSFLVSLISCGVVIWMKNKYLLRGLDKNKNMNEIYSLTLTAPLDKIINDSAFLSQENFLDKLIMLTMNDKKVYVGTVLADFDIFNRFLYGQYDFIFCPIYSGYRHKDTMEVIFTTKYLHSETEQSKKNYQIVLDRKNIISATKVDLDTLLNFTDKDSVLNILRNVSGNKYPILINMKNKNIYIGFLVDSFKNYSLISGVDFVNVKIEFHMVFEKDRLNILQYYDYTNNDYVACINFKEIESFFYTNNSDGIWKVNENITPEVLKNIFNYKLIECKE